jgi:sulfate adenylyltransferase/3'-phosphoadenosine 5'-phosphosulfate synthase
MSGFVVWFTGLSGSGKSTLAAMLAAELRHRGVHVESLDGDEVRTHLSKGLSFSREDRDTNVRRIGFVAKLIARSGACAITAAISPYRAIRDEQRRQIDHFVEVYTRCSIPLLAERDPKGLYKKALAGEIKGFTGIDDPYEAPEHAEVVVDTGVETKEESLHAILAKLEELGLVGALAGTRAGSGLVAPHGGELVDRLARGEARDALAEKAKGLPAVDLDAWAEVDLDRIASGAYSPLKGFMGSKDYLRVVREMRLENGLPWPVPVMLAVTPEEAAHAVIGQEIALRGRDGSLMAVLEVADVWARDEQLEARHLERAPWLAGRGSVYVGGEVRVLARPAAPGLARYRLDPRETRRIFAERGWSRVAAFATSSPMHRGHEHITKVALEVSDGLFVQATEVPGALPLDLLVRCHEALLATYYPESRVLLGVDAVAYHGARGLLLSALTLKNHGASSVVVEAAHTARSIFEAFAPSELGVTPMCFEETFWSSVAHAVATEKTAPDVSPIPDDLRPEVARIVAYQGAAARSDPAS